jgi:hypothetical protein
MGWCVTGVANRVRPVIVYVVFFLIVCIGAGPAGAFSPCTLSANDCPPCSAGGLTLTESSVFNSTTFVAASEADFIKKGMAAATLTCTYGRPSTNTFALMTISCYPDTATAQKSNQYHRKQIQNPFTDIYGTPGSGYYSSPFDSRLGCQADIFSGGGKVDPDCKSGRLDEDFFINGRFEAQIASAAEHETRTVDEAKAINRDRIAKYAACFASFNPGGVPAPQQQVIKGTITGKGFTRETYEQFSKAKNDLITLKKTEGVTAFMKGKATDYASAKPLRHVRIIWKGSQEAGAQDKEYVTSTDANGTFEIPATLTAGKQYQFDIEFTYRKADTDSFSISEAGVYNGATYSHVFEYAGPQDLRQDVDILADLDKADADKEYVAGMTSTLLLYDETANALEFYQDHLGETLDCNLPLGIYPFWPDRRSKFEIDSGRGSGTPSPAIFLTPTDSSFESPDHTQFTLYHEFSHYAMYCIYGKKFPESAADKTGPVKTINHGGYMNPSTSDSFTEGFADFMPAVIAEYYGNFLPEISNGGGSIDDTMSAYDYAGEAEEFAVATTLWHLYNTDSHYTARRLTEESVRRDILDDPGTTAFEANLQKMTVEEYRAMLTHEISLLQSGKNLFDEEHPVKLRFDQLWPVLRTYNRDFTDVYSGLVSRYPGQKAGIDTVFVNHGFYRDGGRGNGSYDPGEPWRAASGDRKTFAAGDPFIDYPSSGFSFNAGGVVGSASEYQRTTRRSQEPLPGHFIRTTVDVPLYIVSVEYYDRPWKSYRTLVSGENNMVPVPVPPPGENAGVTVVPVGVKSASPLWFRSEEFNSNFPAAAARGYYVEHDFKVSGPIPARTVVKAGGTSGAGPGALLSLFLKPNGPLADGNSGPWSRIPLYLSIPVVLIGLAVLVWRLRKE